MAKSATTRQLQCCALFEAEGYMPSGASSLTGNFSQETGPNLITTWRHAHLDHGSQGLPQWRLDRLDAYEAYVRGLHPELTDQAALEAQYGRLDYNVKYVAIELQRDYPELDAALRKGGSVSALTADICWQYERPSKAYANLANRIDQALIVFNSTPGGASYARKTNITAAVDTVADAHDDQRNAGIVATSAAGAVAAGTGIVHIANSIHWYEWVILAIVVFVGICGIVQIVMHAKAAKMVRTAKPNLNVTAKPNTKVPPQPAPTPVVDGKLSTGVTVDAVAAAKQAEQEAIQSAMDKTNAAVAAKTSGATMSIGKAEQG